ncbi:MAG: helix-turn-helix transcriptional regulator [Thermomicrobiales bacterium]|nr:helix-turn-helix transcriptional regulator [Thermomicrobiales bacterium]
MIGHISEAEPNLLRSLALTWHTGYDRALARTLRGVSAIAAATGQAVAGAWLLGAADAISSRAPFLITLASPDQDIRDWSRARLAGRLEPGDLERARRVGAELETEQAVAVAREVLRPGLGEARVRELWEATQAPDPGPAPAPAPPASAPPQALSLAQVPLTRREQEILGLLCQRWTDTEIAEYFFISPRTVNRHVSNILAKLGAANRREAAAIAARGGLA